ncbi:hypothetical protein [Falsiroseomonas sp. HW251]|uniref:hypothetical protein n=1 Tax=Falsiroseomonas sp. HW251 TaxID=3390998 RepID=UPI003D31DC03
MGLLFDGTDLRASFVPGDPAADTVVLTFSGRDMREVPGWMHAFGAGFLRRAGLPAIHLTASWNHWFIVDEMRRALPGLCAAAAPFRHRVAYGQSLGAYAALRHSAALGVTRVVAISPRFSMLPEKVPFDTRSRPELPRLDPAGDDLPGGLSRDATLLVVAETVGMDARHLALIRAACGGRARVLALPFGGHPATLHLRQIGLLGRIVRALLTEAEPDLAAIRRAVRGARGGSAIWWTELARQAWRSGRHDLAAEGALRAATLDPAQHGFAARLVGKLARRGLARRTLPALVARLAALGDAAATPQA